MPIREDKDFVCFLDVEIYKDWGSHTWAQENFLVHGYDDVLWTSNVDSAVGYLRSDLLRIMPNAQQGVQPTAFCVGKRGRLANLLVSLGKYLVKIGGG